MAITKATASSIAPAAKGNLVVGSATNDAAVLGVGANGTILTADSAEATGVKWATPAAGGGMTLLSTTTLSGASTTISGISGSYTNLYIVLKDVYFATSNGDLNMRLNSDTSANYSFGAFGMRNAIFMGDQNNAVSKILIGKGTGSVNTLLSKLYGSITINRYTDTDAVFGTSTATYYDNSQSRENGATVPFIYDGTAAITSVTFYGDYNFSGGTVYIYGVS
jgi:hypothetical protein